MPPARALRISAAAVVAAALAVGAVFAVSGAGARGWLKPSVQALTHLSALPGTPAPGFALTDQRGRRISLSSLRGRVLVLEPMDPKCTNLCPLISQEFIYAAGPLGAANSRVAFVGINVNQYHARPADLMAFSHLHHLDRLSNWYFLTGTTAQLKRVWHEYAIAVQPSRTGDVTHSALMYFIDAHGRERWLAFPSVDPAAIPQWGAAIATVAKHLLG